VFGGGNVGGAGGIGEAGQFEEGLLRLAAGRVAVVGLVNGRRVTGTRLTMTVASGLPAGSRTLTGTAKALTASRAASAKKGVS
jgi:hypothetical protein